MSFNTLLLACLSSETNLSESGNQVGVARKSGEILLLFDLKRQAAAKSILRSDWKMKDDELLCDGIFFWAKEPEKNLNTKRVICFVELKGGDVDHAADQIIHTREVMETVLKQSLRGTSCSQFHSLFVWKAYIFNGKSALNETKRPIEKLKKVFDSSNFRIARESDMGSFLRS